MLLPQPGLGGFAHTTGGEKPVACAVQRHHRGVHDKDILVQQLVCGLAVAADGFQIAVGKHLGLLAPFFLQLLLGNLNGESRGQVGFKSPAQIHKIGKSVVKLNRNPGKQNLNHAGLLPEKPV